MSNIYAQHEKAFKAVEAYVITDDKGERVATVAFKHGFSVTCYLHIIGLEMTKGVANGGGYDRKSASLWLAAQKIKALPDGAFLEKNNTLFKFRNALANDAGGASWDRALREAGYNVLQAV